MRLPVRIAMAAHSPHPALRVTHSLGEKARDIPSPTLEKVAGEARRMRA